MSNYIKKTITDETIGNAAECWVANRLDIDVVQNFAVIMQNGYKDETAYLAGKQPAVPPVIYKLKNIDQLLLDEAKAAGDNLYDAVFQKILGILLSDENSPFYQGTFESFDL